MSCAISLASLVSSVDVLFERAGINSATSDSECPGAVFVSARHDAHSSIGCILTVPYVYAGYPWSEFGLPSANMLSEKARNPLTEKTGRPHGESP